MAIIRKPLKRHELESFYVMTRAYFPNSVVKEEWKIDPNDESTVCDGLVRLFWHEDPILRGIAVLIGTDKRPYYYIGIGDGYKTRRLCRTHDKSVFMAKLKEARLIETGDADSGLPK